MIVAIDHENYAMKPPNFSFVAGISEHTGKPPMADEIWEYEGKYWTLTGNRLSYMRDKTQDNRYFILTLFAAAKELEAAGKLTAFEQIDLAVGLPPEHFGSLKSKFAQYFKKPDPVRFVYKDKPIQIMIRNVLVYPQAYAAVIPHASQLLHTVRMFIIDIGG